MTHSKPTAFIVLLFISFFCNAQYNSANLKIISTGGEDDPANFNLSFSYDNLRLYPIIANDTFLAEHNNIGDFTLLKDAIEKDKILITETGARLQPEREFNNQSEQGSPQNNQIIQNNSISGGNVSGSVNTLIAKNISTDTIFIMAGEVVKGGKQDRVIGKDVVIPPGKEINLSAFCVF